MLTSLKRLSFVFIIVLSLAFFGYLVYTGMGAKTKANISTNVAGNGEIAYSTNGLVAQWNFNETSGTMVRSEGSCGKQCDGQLVNFAYTGSQDAALGTGWTAKNRLWSTGALMFDGVNDEVKVNNFQLLNANFTYEAWIKVTGGTGIESFGTLGPDPTHTWNFAYDNTKKRWDLWDKTNRSWYTDHDIGSTWHHVAVVYNGPTQYLYVDGTLKNSRSIISPIADGGGRTLQIGNTTNPQPLNGMLDAVRIYSRALTEQEIATNFQAQNGVTPTPPPVSTSIKPVGYWKFDEGTGNTVADSSGNGNNGQLKGNNLWSNEGRQGAALNCNGTDSIFLTSGKPDVFNWGTSSWSISLWVNSKDAAGTSQKRLIGRDLDADKGYWWLNWGNGKPELETKDDANVYGPGAKISTSIADGTWHHLAWVVDKSSHKVSSYVDGVQNNSQTESFTGSFPNVNAGVSICTQYESKDFIFLGKVDNVKLYNSAITPQQVTEDMSGTPKTSTTISDNFDGASLDKKWSVFKSGNNTVDQTSGILRVVVLGTGRYGSAGIQTELVTGDFSSEVKISDYSIVNQNNKPANAGLFMQSPTTGHYLGLRVWTNESGVKSVILQDDTLPTMSKNVTNFDSIRLKLQRIGTQAIGYVDQGSGYELIGILNNVTKGDGNLKAQSEAGELSTGSSLSVSFDNFSAKVNLASALPTPTPKPLSLKPVGYWKFDEGTGNTVADSSGNGNNGTFAGTGSHWVDGKVGKAGNFNGTDDVVTLQSQPNFSKFSITAWVNLNSTGFDNYQEIFNNNQFFLRKDNSVEGNKFSAFVKLGDNSVEPRVSSVTIPTPGNWYHISATWDGTQLKLYVNGAFEGFSARSGVINSNNVSAQIGKGEQLSLTHNPFFGKIDDLKIYSYIRTSEQIAEDMSGTPKTSTTISDNFDGVSLDMNKWNTWKSPSGTQAISLNQESGVVKIKIDPNQTVYSDGVIELKEVNTGDFEASVDIKVEQAESKNTADTILLFHSIPWGNQIIIGLRKEATGIRVFANRFFNGQWGSEPSNPVQMADKITVILKRVGNSAIYNYRINNGEIKTFGIQDAGFNGDGRFILLSDTFGQYPSLTATFNNFSAKVNLASALPTPTPIPQALTATPVPTGSLGGGAQLLFKVRMPDISTSVGTVGNVKIEIKDKAETLFDFTTGLQRIQGTDYFSTPAPIELDIPNGTYTIYIKQLKTIRRSFTANLTRGKTLDCTQKNADTSCQSLGKPELSPLFSGDSDGFLNSAGSYNKIDAADLQKIVAKYGVSPLPAEPNGDFNLDGKIDVQDLGILGKNFGKKGD